MADMLAFTDSQLRIMWNAAERVPVEKRGTFCALSRACSGPAASPTPISTTRYAQPRPG
ncbi:MAG: hypothetical protein WAK55_17960 [Xanthobacteraceae bacterium]